MLHTNHFQSNNNAHEISARYREQSRHVLDSAVSDEPLTQEMQNDNLKFLSAWRHEYLQMNNRTAQQLHQLITLQNNYQRELSNIRLTQVTQESRHQEERRREEVVSVYRGVEAGFGFIAELGALNNNPKLQAIGAIGSAGVSVALSVASIAGWIPGVTVSGWGLMLPGFGIATSALAIFNMLKSRRRNKHAQDQQAQALNQLAEFINRWNQTILQRIDIFESNVVGYFKELADRGSFQTSLIQTTLSDGFNQMTARLDTLQLDLNRLSELSQKEFSATYMQTYNLIIDNLSRLIRIKADRSTEIEKRLLDLTAWLANEEFIKNTNATWCLPNDLRQDNVFSQQQLRNHNALLEGPLENRLGYLAHVAKLIPGMIFTDVNIDIPPNIGLYIHGLESYLSARIHLGIAGAKNMDPSNESLKDILKTAQNGIDFMKQLSAQEKRLLTRLTEIYERTYRNLCDDIRNGAYTRLATSTVPGFEFPIKDPLQNIHWPRNVSHHITDPNLPDLAFSKVSVFLEKPENAHLRIHRLIKSALAVGVGNITATYTASVSGSGTRWFDTERGDYWGGILQYDRSVEWHVDVHYVLNNEMHLLFSIAGATLEKIVYKQESFRSKKYEQHHQIVKDRQSSINTINASAVGPLYTESWNDRTVFSKAQNNPNEMTDVLKEAIWTSIVNACVIRQDIDKTAVRLRVEAAQRLAQGDAAILTEDRQIAAIIATRTLLIDQIRANANALLHRHDEDLTLIKNLLVRYGVLLNTPMITDINALWDTESFNTNMAQYYNLDLFITRLKIRINGSVHGTVSNNMPAGLSYQRIPGDGNCLFTAVGLYLGQDAAFLRSIVAAHMEENIADFRPFYAGENRSFEQHIGDIRTGHEWGSHIEIEVIQRLTNRPIIIIRPDANPTIPDNLGRYLNPPIFVWYNAVNHYDTFTVQEGHDAGGILTEIQTRIAQGQLITYSPDLTQFHEHSRINGIQDNLNRQPHSILVHLYYGAHLITSLNHYESTLAFTATQQLAKDLDVDQIVIFDAARIQCDFRKENLLGRGSFGQVFRATDSQTHNPLAIKRLLPGTKFLGGELNVLARLAQARGVSPYLAVIYGVTQLHERDMIVMEYVPNRTLTHHLFEKNPSLALAERKRIAREIVLCLQYLHDNNIIHGDLKTDNLLMTNDLHIKATDFGLSRLETSSEMSSSIQPSDQALNGTAAYRAPELFDPQNRVGHTKESDIYALGVILYALLADRPPFQDLRGGYLDIITFWVHVRLGAVTDELHFPMPAKPSAVEHPIQAQLYTFLKDVVMDCRKLNANERPSISTVAHRLGNSV